MRSKRQLSIFQGEYYFFQVQELLQHVTPGTQHKDAGQMKKPLQVCCTKQMHHCSYR